MPPVTLGERELRALHAVQLEMLVEFDRVCAILGLKYQLAAGTLLGAVRHRGFIPWDDDADVMMLRRDYDRFLREAPAHLGRDYFLQHRRSDPHHEFLYAKLRRNGSCFRETVRETSNCHQGIFLDLFPFDAIDDGSLGGRWHLAAIFAQRRLAAFAHHHRRGRLSRERPGWQRLVARLAYPLVRRVPERWMKNIEEQLMRLRRGSRARYVVCLAALPGDGRSLGSRIRPVSELTETILLPFADRQFAVPRDFHVTLTRLYGDYMKFPPEEQRRPAHPISEFRLPPGF